MAIAKITKLMVEKPKVPEVLASQIASGATLGQRANAPAHSLFGHEEI